MVLEYDSRSARRRLMAVRSFHPGPWRVRGGTLVDADGMPVDFDIAAVRTFFEHLLGDLEAMTEAARRHSVTRELSPSVTGLRAPSAPPQAVERVDVARSSIPPRSDVRELVDTERPDAPDGDSVAEEVRRRLMRR